LREPPIHSGDLRLHLICTRVVPIIDSETLCDRTGREALFRKEDCFILYMSDGELSSLAQERLISLTPREALIWLNEREEDVGTFWD
jgi:hypothetical protein